MSEQSVLTAPFTDSYKEKISETLRSGELLGKGTQYQVRRIPGQSDYAFRIPLNFDLSEESLASIRTPQNPLLNMNAGQAILEIGRVQLVRVVPGETTRLPYGLWSKEQLLSALKEKSPIPLLAKDTAPCRRFYVEHLHKVERMPQSAYDELALRIKKIQNAGLYIDPFVLNVLVDEKKQKFYTIDHSNKIGVYENIIGMACPLIDSIFVYLDGHARNHKPMLLQGMLIPLFVGIYYLLRKAKLFAFFCASTISILCYGAFKLSQPNVSEDSTLIACRRNILKKVFLASHTTGLAIPEEPCPVMISNQRRRAFGIDFACDVSGFSGKWPEIKKLLEDKTLSREELSKALDNL